MPSVMQKQLLSLQISSSHLLTVTFSTYPSQRFSDALGTDAVRCTGWHRLLAALPAPCQHQAEREGWQAQRGEKHGKVPNSNKSPGQFVEESG